MKVSLPRLTGHAKDQNDSATLRGGTAHTPKKRANYSAFQERLFRNPPQELEGHISIALDKLSCYPQSLKIQMLSRALVLRGADSPRTG
mgnify:CR=1 FL=1